MRYRVYAALVGIALLGWLGAWGYRNLWLPAVLPATACLDQGWSAIQEGEYPTAERCFAAAARKDPPPGVMPIALHVLYFRKWRDTPLAPRHIEILAHLPLVRLWMRPVELHWRNLDEMAGFAWLQRDAWPHDGYLTRGVACRVFDDYWPTDRAEVLAVIGAIDAVRARRFAEAYDALHTLETRRPETFRRFVQSAPLVLRNYAAAAQVAHPQDAPRLRAAYRRQPACYVYTYDDETDWQRHIDPAQG